MYYLIIKNDKRNYGKQALSIAFAGSFLWRQHKIDDIYVFEVNTKYISSNVLRISEISRVRRTSEIADIFNTWDEIFLVFTEKK